MWFRRQDMDTPATTRGQRLAPGTHRPADTGDDVTSLTWAGVFAIEIACYVGWAS